MILPVLFGRRKALRLALAGGILLTLAGTSMFALTPVCNGGNVYPCSVGGTLIVSSKPILAAGGGSGVISFGGGRGTITHDPLNPGICPDNHHYRNSLRLSNVSARSDSLA